MSSLQKQLALIQAKSTNELDLKAQKAAHSKSLLFEPAIAATQSLDVIYQLCYEGFEELCALDQRFVRFDRSIFGPQSRKEDRLQMTELENKELNAVLETFLGLVGARLLLKPAIKAVEWLVRRFRIHEYNTESFILTFLPYHATAIFAIVLSILPKELPPTFKFLHPYMSQLINPSRGVIVFSASRNPPFFSALNRYVLSVARAQHTYHVLLSFWASVVAQSINDMLDTSASGRQNIQHQREEDLLVRILPTLNEGLDIRHVPELTLGCYMLIAVLVSKARLGDRMLDAFMITVTKSMTRDTCDAALGCAAVIAEQREGIKLPKSVLKGILKLTNVSERLRDLVTQQPVQRLMMGICQGILGHIGTEDVPQGLALLTFSVQGPVLDPNSKRYLLEQISDVLRRPDQPSGLSGSSHRQLVGLSEVLRKYGPEELYRKTSAPDQTDHNFLETTAAPDPFSPADEVTDTNDDGIPGAAMETRVDSFLANIEHGSFEVLLRAFEHSVQHEAKMRDLLRLPFLGASTSVGDVRYLSFLIRIWCTTRSISTKCAALRKAREHIASTNAATSGSQALVPYTLTALADPSAKVRRCAADLMAVLGLAYGTAAPKTYEIEMRQQAVNSLYASSPENLYWLSHKCMASFITSRLVTGLEECVSDGNHISRLVQGSFERHGEGLKATQRPEVFTFLCSHTQLTPLYGTKMRLLSVLNGVDRIGSQPRSYFLRTTRRQLVALSNTEVSDICAQETFDVEDFTAQTLATIHPDDQEAVADLLVLIQGEGIRENLQLAAFSRLIALWPILKKPRQKAVVESLFSASLPDSKQLNSSTYQDESINTLKAIRIPADILLTLVEQATSELNQHEYQSAPKRRRSNMAERLEVSILDAEKSRRAMSKITFVLELVDISKPKAHLELLYALFRVLQVTHDYRNNTESDLGYLQDLILGSLSTLIGELDRDASSLKLNDSLIRVDLLVECVRNTASIYARNLALLLLSDLTKYTPQAVLHSIMPIFTLMSTTTVRQSDENSAHVVDQIIQRVVPLLANTLREQRKNLVQATAEILLSFAAAFEHITPHRRLRLYSLLASSLGAGETLFAIIATLVDRFPGNDEIGHFIASLFRDFESVQSLTTINKYLELALDCLQPKPSLARTLLRDDEMANTQLQASARLLAAAPILLKDTTFRSKMAHDLCYGTDAPVLRNLFSNTLEATLRLSHIAAGQQLLRLSCTRVLECVLDLFPLDQLAQSIDGLLDHPNQDICRSILKTLEARIRTIKNVDALSRDAVVQLLPRLTTILEDPGKGSIKSSALGCIDQVCGRFGKTDLNATFAVAEVIASDHCVGSPDPILSVLSLHCLASSVEILRNDFIPLFQQAMQAALECLRVSMIDEQKNEKLHNAAYAFFTAVADHVPFMLSKASMGAVLKLSHRSALAGFKGEGDESRCQFLQLVATRLDLAIVLDVSREEWQDAVQRGSPALNEHIGLLRTTIENHSKASIVQNIRIIFSSVLETLDFRRVCASDELKQLYSGELVDSTEQLIVQTVISLVLKINDAVFRPFFSQVLEWSCTGMNKRGNGGKELRLMTVFNLAGALSERLKSIFTGYFDYILERSKEVLDSITTKDPSNQGQALKICVIRALNSSFKHDQDDFWQAPAHFDIILDPMVSQLSTLPALQAMSEVIPAITELGAAAASHDHHHALNGRLLKLLRADNSSVRLAAVKCQESLAARLGDEWLSHLPEMLPLINELQDDDDEGVERETHKWIKLIEDTLGESLNSMLQ